VGNIVDPLKWLAGAEEAYHFVYNTLPVVARNKKIRIVEVGSGLGYLTYAMHRAGYEVLGIDVSKKAVDDACMRFGKLYQCMDVADMVGSHAKCDGIVITEVLEHVEDVFKLFDSLDGLLAPSGFVLLTTPNKSFYPNTFVWHTELPPVHLWWFGESSMRVIALKYNYSVRFFDYTSWNTSHQALATLSCNRRLIRDTSPVITLTGHIQHNKWIAPILKRSVSGLQRLIHGLRTSSQRSFMASHPWDISRSSVMGVIFQKAKASVSTC
jgi:SAM-dependent methyltransferase